MIWFHLVIALLVAEGGIVLLAPGFVKRVVDACPPNALRVAGAAEIAFAVIVAALAT